MDNGQSLDAVFLLNLLQVVDGKFCSLVKIAFKQLRFILVLLLLIAALKRGEQSLCVIENGGEVQLLLPIDLIL